MTPAYTIAVVKLAVNHYRVNERFLLCWLDIFVTQFSHWVFEGEKSRRTVKMYQFMKCQKRIWLKPHHLWVGRFGRNQGPRGFGCWIGMDQ